MEHLLLDNNGNLVLIDFNTGFLPSEQQHHDGENHLLIGSSAHQAPEIFEMLEYSYASDLWSAAISLYELVGGALPWNFGSLHEAEQQGEIINQRTRSARIAKPSAMSEGLWSEVVSRILTLTHGHLLKLSGNAQDTHHRVRITVEEAIAAGVFSALAFSTYAGATRIPGNLFNERPELAPVRAFLSDEGLVPVPAQHFTG
jgi:serine/threonine protein kinase